MLASEGASKSLASYFFLFLLGKLVKVGYTRNVSFEKKLCQSL